MAMIFTRRTKVVLLLSLLVVVSVGVGFFLGIVLSSVINKKKEDPAWKYVEAFAGSDIETNPPGTNKAVQESGRTITSHIDELPSAEVLAQIAKKVDIKKLEETLMQEGLAKFADPQKALLKLIAEKRAALVGAK